jgi:hypothetical protein
VFYWGRRPGLFLKYPNLFPLAEHLEAAKADLSFEIDKVNKRFKTTGVDAEEATEDFVDGLEDAFQASAIIDNKDKEDKDEDEDEEDKNGGKVKVMKKIKQRLNFLKYSKEPINLVSFCLSNKLQ